LHLDVVLQDLHTFKNIEGVWNHFLKLVEAEADQHVMVPWEPIILLLIKVQPNLFHLLPYMLRKFDLGKLFARQFQVQACKLLNLSKKIGWMDWQLFGIIWSLDSQRSSKP
jgi:hypothetical protein